MMFVQNNNERLMMKEKKNQLKFPWLTIRKEGEEETSKIACKLWQIGKLIYLPWKKNKTYSIAARAHIKLLILPFSLIKESSLSQTRRPSTLWSEEKKKKEGNFCLNIGCDVLFIQNWINCGRMVCEMNNRYHNIRPLTTMDEVPSTLLPKLCIFYIFLAWFVFMFFCRCFKCSLLSFSIHHFFLSHTRDIEWKTFLLKCLTLACRMPLGFFFKMNFYYHCSGNEAAVRKIRP